MATLREIAVLNNLDEFIDVIDNVEEDTEIAVLTGPKLAKADSTLFIPEKKVGKVKTKKSEKPVENDLNKSFVQNGEIVSKKQQKPLPEVNEKASTCSIL